MNEWTWVSREWVLEAHARLITRFGGLSGIIHEGGVDAALAAPRWLYKFADPDSPPDIAVYAAAYLVSLAEAHAFNDGNKRIAWTTAAAFLHLNGFSLTVSQADIIETVGNIADAGHPMAEGDLILWFRKRIKKRVA